MWVPIRYSFTVNVSPTADSSQHMSSLTKQQEYWCRKLSNVLLWMEAAAKYTTVVKEHQYQFRADYIKNIFTAVLCCQTFLTGNKICHIALSKTQNLNLPLPTTDHVCSQNTGVAGLWLPCLVSFFFCALVWFKGCWTNLLKQWRPKQTFLSKESSFEESIHDRTVSVLSGFKSNTIVFFPPVIC